MTDYTITALIYVTGGSAGEAKEVAQKAAEAGDLNLFDVGLRLIGDPQPIREGD